MPLNDIEIYRSYKCCNKECEGVIAVKQKSTEDFLKTCPFCHQDELVIESAKLSISMVMELSKPKTYGMIGQQNQQRKEKEEGVVKKKDYKRPWWRNQDKINYNILKNPKNYINTGVA